MGSEQSSSSKNEREAQEKFTKDEVKRMLEKQRELFDKSVRELVNENHSTAHARETAREEARKEIEKVMREKKEEENRRNAQANISSPSNLTSIPLERKSTPYSFKGQDLKNGTITSPSSNVNIYPNLSNHSPTSSFSLSSPSSDENPHKYPEGVLTSVRSRNVSSECTPGILTSVRSHGNNSGCVSGVLTSVRSRHTDYSNQITTNVQGERFLPSAPQAPRARSISRNRNAANHGSSNVNGDVELNCPTCRNSYSLRIFQCHRGHSSCLHCKNRGASCGVCGLHITDMRNHPLEAYIGERKINCVNSSDGCKLFIKLADMDNHLKECPFGEMPCPLASIFGQCTWRGKLPQLESHFDEFHEMHRQGNVDTEMRLINLSHDNHIVHYILMGNFNFIFHAKVSEREGVMYMTVQLIGTQTSALKWSYGIHIYNKAEPRRKYEYSDTCNSINTPINTIFISSQCAVIPLAYAKTFMNNNSVTYKFFIKRDVENKNNSGKNNCGRGARRRQN